MKLSIMQPYFFPYIGYYQLIVNSDLFLIFDEVQYGKKGWMNRNRILHNKKEWTYVRIIINKASQVDLIKDITIRDKYSDLQNILGNLTIYKKYAPYYEQVIELLKDVFEKCDDSLVSINYFSIFKVLQYIGIEYEIKISSQMNFNYSNVTSPGDWAFEISKQVGASEYINLPGGKNLFRQDDFFAEGIQLTFLDVPKLTYEPKPFTFIPNLSIIDVLMWNSPKNIKKYLEGKVN